MNDANNAGTLLPCPFCGGSAAHYTSAESVFKAEWTGHVYHCTECQARVQNTDRRTAQEMWNTRALSTPNARPAMTSHHDVAGVVAELREKQMFLLNGGSFLKPDPFLQDVADLLESQAKALSEAERKARHLLIAANQYQARLAEAMKVIERDMEALTEADTQIEYLHASGANAIARIDIALTAARAFTNAAKEKT